MFGYEKKPNISQKSEFNDNSEKQEDTQERVKYQGIIDYCKNNIAKFLREHPGFGRTARNVAFTTMSLGAVFNSNSAFSQNVEDIEKDKIDNIEVVVAKPEIKVENEKTILISKEMIERSYDHGGGNISDINYNSSGYLADSGKNVIIEHQSIKFDQSIKRDDGEKIFTTFNDQIVISQGSVENVRTEGEPIRVKHVGRNQEEAITNALGEASDQISVMVNSETENEAEENNENIKNKFTSFVNIKSSHEIKSYKLISTKNIDNENIEVEIEVIPYI